MELKISTSAHSDHALVAVRGEIDLYTAPRLHSELVAALDNAGGGRLLVEMSQVEFCDSTGINVLLSGLKRARERSGDLEIVAPSGTVSKILEVTGLDAVFRIHPTLDTVRVATAAPAE
ncbi:STAS domain-containing protein [Spiractinospora alimapuensis]|uniref:STAS domain-containing protein n=1 Tax=Spiractinospora alimapuensis TaxID=2820884 RepID=UPI0022AB2100|nr:STAS domain-containing protein [Spiractinospora alimapuensis]